MEDCQKPSSITPLYKHYENNKEYMLTAHYIGSHRGDTLIVRAGWAFTRMVQRGYYQRVTHSEAVHELHSDGSVTIASSSVRDNGVRPKQVYLNADNWIIIDVPAWDVQRSIELLDHTNGHNYDMLGAMSTALLIGQRKEKWFCNEWVGHPFIPSAYIFGPAQFAALCASQGRDITQEFFKERQHLVNKGP